MNILMYEDDNFVFPGFTDKISITFSSKVKKPTSHERCETIVNPSVILVKRSWHYLSYLVFSSRACINKQKKAIIKRTPKYSTNAVQTCSFNIIMMPAIPSEAYGIPYSYAQRYRRQTWIPSKVSFRPFYKERNPLRYQMSKWCDPMIRYTSADELCAANVLISLSPKVENLHRPDHPQYCSPVGSNNIYNQRWGNYYKSNASHDFESSSSHGHTRDTSSEASVGDSSSEASRVCSSEKENTRTWYEGSISLSLPEDDDVLSPLHCFMRRYCVEAFSATPEDVSTPRYGKSHGVKVVVGQIGIRCLYCKHRPVGNRPDRAICYPSSLRNIYHSIETWQRRHSLVCSDITPWVKRSIMELTGSSKSRAGGRRQYWEESAMRLGMEDTPYGAVRFARPPGDLGRPQALLPRINDFPSTSVVREVDRELVTEYLFLLLEQMQSCRFTEEDRSGGRSKNKDNDVGFPGIQCKHCHGKAGFGRYFPTSLHALSLANSDRNIFNHIHKCRRCPQHIKAELLRLSKNQSQCKNGRGLRKMFFERVWGRMHGKGTFN